MDSWSLPNVVQNPSHIRGHIGIDAGGVSDSAGFGTVGNNAHEEVSGGPV